MSRKPPSAKDLRRRGTVKVVNVGLYTVNGPVCDTRTVKLVTIQPDEWAESPPASNREHLRTL